jgi:3-mercaptopyruvate sulfurtransferase SseA
VAEAAAAPQAKIVAGVNVHGITHDDREVHDDREGPLRGVFFVGIVIFALIVVGRQPVRLLDGIEEQRADLIRGS